MASKKRGDEIDARDEGSATSLLDVDALRRIVELLETTDITRLSFCVFVIVVLTLAALGVANLARGDTGRAFLAVRSNERAAAAANEHALQQLALAARAGKRGDGGDGHRRIVGESKPLRVCRQR